MKIIKYKKSKKNTYELLLDDSNIIILYDDVIIKYNLLIDKEVDEKKLEEITSYNAFLENYYRAINYINKKMRTEKEIKKYLEKYTDNITNINKIINILYKDGYLNKERYIKAYINDQYNLTLNGPIKVENDLIGLGYLKEDIIEYLETFNWEDRIDKLISKKKKNNKISNNNLKIKILNDIIKLGYDKNIISEKLENIEFDSDIEILKKEFNKIFKKYSLKYSDYELEYKVINYLYKKGFNVEDIKRCYNEK